MLIKAQKQQGQVLLIVVLVLVVSLTIGLSVVTRSITTLRTAQEEQSSQKAFAAAEAGVEKILNSTSGTTNLNGSIDNITTFQATSVPVTATNFIAHNNSIIAKNDAVDVWLSNYPNYAAQFSGNININWAKTADVCDPSPAVNTRSALEIVLVSGIPTAPTTTHFAYDPCATRRTSNNFTQTTLSGSTLSGVAFSHRVTIAVTNGIMMRITPLYASTKIGIDGGATTLPKQGDVIESTGSSGGTVRKISVFRGYPEIPAELFPYLVFSP